jgi:hypothetical protein
MSALIFLFVVAVIFGLILAVEVQDEETQLARRPLGLVGWLTGGNWPAKIGGALIVVGCGALLRFALINLAFPPVFKLAGGVGAAGLLGLGATVTRGAGRRAVSLALGGAAFGVAYLTAYSAFALFHYCASPEGVALLALTALAAGVYAMTRGAISLALLAMLGAYLAPAFATSDPGPNVVFGYLAGASLLSLVMVAVRGWRPLIHLSFLFSLGGGLFFTWTAHYYQPQNADVMLPAIIVLAGLHVLMPLAEKRGASGAWIERLDIAYTIVLPAIAGLSAFLIAPTHERLSNELLALSVLWFAASAYLAAVRRDGAVLHAVIGVVLAGSAVAARFRDLPWELIALAFSVIAFWLAARRSQSTRLQGALASLIPLAGFLHILDSLIVHPRGQIFLNELFLERLVGAGLLMFAARIARSVRNTLDTLLWSVGVGWAVAAVGFEVLRWDLLSLATLLQWGFLMAAALLAYSRSAHRSIPDLLVVVVVGVAASALLAAGNASPSVSWASLIAAPLILSWLSIRRAGAESQTRVGRTLAAMTAPVVAGIWAIHIDSIEGIHAPQFVFCAMVVAALMLVVLGDVARERCRDWRATAVHLYTYLFAIPLALSTTLAIGRSGWAIALELLCVAGLALLVAREPEDVGLPRWVAPGCAVGLGLVVQANLLRWLGPPGNLNIGDVLHMRLTAVVSLVWVSLGALLTGWGRRSKSRTLWGAGAALLVAAAAKLVLIDFGVLGQLGNILAVIAAGIVFMLVGWFAPMPPAAPSGPKAPARQPSPVGAHALTPAAGSAPVARSTNTPTQSGPTSRMAGVPESLGSRTAGESWDWNMTHARHAGAVAEEPARNDRLIWTIAILALCSFLLQQCHALRTPLQVTRPPTESVRQTATVTRPAPVPPSRRRTVTDGGVAREQSHLSGSDAAASLGSNSETEALPEASPEVVTPQSVATEPATVRIVAAVYASSQDASRAVDVTESLREQCPSEAQRCTLICSNQLGGDPDFGAHKYCDVSYQCGDRGTHSVRSMEGARVVLNCR